MYKGVARFQDYMGRSNTFVDRIIAGGNRLDTGLVYEETSVDILRDSFLILLERRFELAKRARLQREERSEFRRNNDGHPTGRYARIAAKYNARYQDTMSELDTINLYVEMISGRLANLTGESFSVPSLGMGERHRKRERDKARSGPRLERKKKERARWLNRLSSEGGSFKKS